MTSRTPKATAEAYFEAWRAKDFDTFNSADDLIKAITQLGGLVKTLEKRNVLVDGQDVGIIYDLVPVKDAPNVGMAELYQVVDDKISAIRIIFDTAAFSAIF